jgi:hypothetical protein
MSITSLRIVAFVVFLLVVPSSGASEPPKGFRDLVWRASPSYGLKKTTGRTDQVEMYVPRSKKKPPPLFDVP